MTITTYENLGRWFRDKKGTEDAPFWNLYGLTYGKTDQVVHRNVDITDMGESSRHLEEVVRMLNNPEGKRFRLVVYAPGKHNNPTASVDVEIYEKSAAPAYNSAPAIAGLPPGVGSVQELVAKEVQVARLQWELDALKDQMNAPSDTWERVLSHVSGIPGIDKVLQTVIIGLVSRFTPQAMPAVQAAMNGAPSAMAEGDDDDEPETDPAQAFQQNIAEASQMLGVDPVTMSAKLKNMIAQNPELARQLMSTT